jgi:anti-sigma factor RsiW
MKNCWQDGDLRAYIDGELTPDVQQTTAAHLEACSTCGARYRELAERAAWVYATIELSEAALPARPQRWLVGAAGLAAALAMAFFLLPKHAPVRPAPAATKVAVPPAPEPPTAPTVAHRVMRRPAPRPPAPAEEFVRLDDYPIETATVVRVSAEDGALQADLIVGPDGRAHAIRIVRNR